MLLLPAVTASLWSVQEESVKEVWEVFDEGRLTFEWIIQLVNTGRVSLVCFKALLA
jgi:hypothetical protein